MKTNDENKKENYLKGKEVSIILTIIVMVIGSFLYFGIDGIGNSLMMGGMKVNPDFFDGIRLKVAFNDEGQMKVFANVQNNKISKLRAEMGNPIPEENSMVIGYEEAMMMQDEELFKEPGDSLDGFFGIRTKLEGILRSSGGIVDYMHFLSVSQFEAIQERENKAFIRLSEDKLPKLFYQYKLEDGFLNKAEFESGGMGGYETHSIGGEKFYPIVIGSKEAEMMKSEKLFTKVGDSISGFFGKNVIISGILSETNTTRDFIHFTQLSVGEI